MNIMEHAHIQHPPADMLLKLEDILDQLHSPANRTFVSELIVQMKTGQVTALTDCQLSTLTFLYRMHFA